MIRSTLKKLLGRALGRKTPPPSTRPSPPRQPPPRPAAREEEEEEQDHGHDHGHSHGHSHDHGGARAEPAPTPAPAAATAPEPKEPAPERKAAKKAVEVVAEDTPNPNARKFTTSATVVEKGSLSFNTAEEAERHPLGKALWACGGVRGVFAVKDFVTVTKDDSADWAKLSPKVVKAIKKAL